MSDQNIVFLVIDCLRVDRLGCYGATTTTTPAIDRLAADGIVFEQAIAMGFHTLTAMASTMTGCYPSTYGGFGALAQERPRLPQVLQSLGYRTAAFTPNPYLSEARGYKPGFDHFDECAPELSPGSTTPRGWLIRGFNRLFKRWGIGVECPPYLNARLLTERATDWLEGAESPFFLWVHYMDAHMPYGARRCSLLLPGGRGQRPFDYGFWKRLRLAPERVTEQELGLANRLYDDAVRFVDDQVSRLIQRLEALGQLDRTTLVIMSDHGEAFFERGLFGHSNYLYDEIIHVPLILVPAGRVAAGRRVSAQVRQLDLAPTLIELAGGTPPAEMQGVSLVDCLQGESLQEHLPAISQTNPANNWMISLRQPPWKLIWRLDPGTWVSHGVELYHLEDDPGERNDLAGRFPERASLMQERLREHVGRLDLGEYGGPEPEEMYPEVLARLQALGYVDDA